MPLGHLGLNVPDLVRAKAFYDQFMPLVDYEPLFARDDEFAYRPAQEKVGTWIFFYPATESADYSRLRLGLQHLAFMVKTRAAVHAVHEWAVGAGHEIVHPPQEFPQYHEGYYATFLLDPHGFMLEVVCHRDR